MQLIRPIRYGPTTAIKNKLFASRRGAELAEKFTAPRIDQRETGGDSRFPRRAKFARVSLTTRRICFQGTLGVGVPASAGSHLGASAPLLNFIGGCHRPSPRRLWRAKFARRHEVTKPVLPSAREIRTRTPFHLQPHQQIPRKREICGSIGLRAPPALESS